MRFAFWSRMLLAAAIVTVSLAGTSMLCSAQGRPGTGWSRDKGQQDEQKKKDDAKALKEQQDAKSRQDMKNGQDKKGKDDSRDVRNGDNRDGRDSRESDRLSRQQEQKLIEQEKERVTQYRQHVDEEVRVAPQRIERYQQEKREAQYSYQKDYLERLRKQQQEIERDRNYDFSRDPYYRTAPNYRYSRGGRDYEINQYGVDLLKQAVNYGYAEGFRAGQADRRDRPRGWWFWGRRPQQPDYRDCFAYQDANYGYHGRYVDRDTYNYYFREGFGRGYEDGYNSRYRYGRYDNGDYRVLEAVLGTILILHSIR